MSSQSTNHDDSNSMSKSTSEPALNQPQEAFVREAPSVTSLSTSGKKSGSGRKKGVFRRKSRNSVLPTATSGTSNASSSNSSSAKSNSLGVPSREPVFSTDFKTQNTKLVTPRQRQEIYALNRVMTRLENEKFKRFCHEKGYKGDLGARSGEKEVMEYDIFM